MIKTSKFSTNLITSLSLAEGLRGLSPGEQARIFRVAMGLPLGEPGNAAAVGLQDALIREEFNEWQFATSNENELERLASLVFACFQLAAARGWSLDTAMQRVFESNMTKLDNEGNPVKNAAGEVMKGPNYVPPDFSDLV